MRPYGRSGREARERIKPGEREKRKRRGHLAFSGLDLLQVSAPNDRSARKGTHKVSPVKKFLF